jgi:uncharacterized membrane protein
MKKLIGEGLSIITKFLCIILFVILMSVWLFFPDMFSELPTNDLIMFVMVIIIGFIPDKD